MSIRAIAYGTENGKDWFVQTCCGEEHYGQDCDCTSYSEKLTEEEAISGMNDMFRKKGKEKFEESNTKALKLGYSFA